MNYKAAILPMPDNSADVQKLINTAVPDGYVLISASPYTVGGEAKILIVCAKKP